MKAVLLSVAALLLACGAPEEGAANVRGTLYGVDFGMVNPCEIHGAGPFLIRILRPDVGSGSLGPDDAVPGRFIEITQPRLPPSGVELPLGVEEDLQAEVQFITAGPARREGEQSGPDFLFPDGSFIAHPVEGSLTLDYDKRTPGSGVKGRFRLVFQTGETLEGELAAALAD